MPVIPKEEKQMSLDNKISRREFVRLAGLTATGALLGACAPVPAPSATQAPAQAAATAAPAAQSGL